MSLKRFFLVSIVSILCVISTATEYDQSVSAQTNLYTGDFNNVSIDILYANLNLSDKYYLSFVCLIDIDPTTELATELAGVPAKNLFAAELYYNPIGTDEEILIAVTDIPEFGNFGYNQNIVAFSFSIDESEEKNLQWFAGVPHLGYTFKSRKKPNVFAPTVMNKRGTVDDPATEDMDEDDSSDDIVLNTVESNSIQWSPIYEDRFLAAQEFGLIVRYILTEIQDDWKEAGNDVPLVQSATTSDDLTSAGSSYLYDVSALFPAILRDSFQFTVERSSVSTKAFESISRNTANQNSIDNTIPKSILTKAANQISIPYHVYTALVVAVGFSGVVLLIFKFVSSERNTLVLVWMFILLMCAKVGLVHITVVLVPATIIVFGVLYSKVFMRSGA